MNKTQMERPGRRGFTLVELLVVIAIISILAAIVVPNVVQYLGRGQMARAVSEIRNADTSLTGMLADVGRSRFVDFLDNQSRTQLRNMAANVAADPLANYDAAQRVYNQFFYTLLRQGRDYPEGGISESGVTLRLLPEVRNKLGTVYMDVRADPWGNEYNFWLGGTDVNQFLRTFRTPINPGDVNYTYDQQAKIAADQKSPGNAPFDNLPGFPPSKRLPVYIWSIGPNQLNDAYLPLQEQQIDVDAINDPVFRGGGDDPNNFDPESGWQDAPK